MIEFDLENENWRLTVVDNPNISAVSTSSFQTLVLGNHEWTIQNDRKCQKGTLITRLSLTACKTDQYTCNDGLCLPLDQRCNGKPECKDKSDELECTIVVKDDSYNKFLAPPPKTSGMLLINVSVDIFTVSSFDPIESSFQSQFQVSLTWIDKRLSFSNLRNSSESNGLSPKEQEIIFENTNDKIKSIVDESTRIIVIKEGEAERTDDTSTENKLLYKGLENPVKYERFYNLKLECDYSLQFYPFDSQRCLIKMQPRKDLLNFIFLNPGKFSYKGPKLLMTYEVKSVMMKLSEGDAGLEVEVLVRRRLLSILLTVFVPTLLLNLI